MPRSIVVLVGLLCLSCSSPTPTAQSPEAAVEEAAPWEMLSINGATYRRVAAKPTEAQADAVITISIPVTVSGGNIIIADEITIAGKTYTANCSATDGPSDDDVGNSTATATDLLVMAPEHGDNFTWFRSKTYRLTPGDVDVFRLRVPEQCDLMVLSAPDDNTTDTYGTLRSSSGRLLARNDDSSVRPPNFTLFLRGVSPGVMYLEVKGATSGASGPYELWTGTRVPGAGKPVASQEKELERQLALERLGE